MAGDMKPGKEIFPLSYPYRQRYQERRLKYPFFPSKHCKNIYERHIPLPMKEKMFSVQLYKR
jgi:hypothetical protein